MKPYIKYYLIAIGIIVLDQIVKISIKTNMTLGDEMPLIGNIFKIHFIENPGAAFGITVSNLVNTLGSELSATTGKLILSVFSILAVSIIGFILYKVSFYKTQLPLFVAMIFGGAIGNIIDRVFYGVWFASINDYQGGLFHGRVVDMFYFDMWEGFIPDAVPFIGGTYMSLWPIWNVADSAISIGIVAILLFQKRLLALPESVKEALPLSSEIEMPEIQPSNE